MEVSSSEEGQGNERRSSEREREDPCLQSSMAALREVVCVSPMVALNESST
ncbi:hypothetical protein AMTR_s00018p00188040, partial [Amborella trichopoda]